jgi:hypothetical protein
MSHLPERDMNTDEPRVLLPDQLFIRKTFLADDLTLRQSVLRDIHDSPAGGHPGISNTWHLVQHKYEGPRLCEFVENYVKGCT